MVLIVAKCIVNIFLFSIYFSIPLVLIVAKCIVNFENSVGSFPRELGINSSKVYCKYLLT